MESVSTILPNEVWTIIWQYHRKNIRKIAAMKKQQLHNDLHQYFEHHNNNNNILLRAVNYNVLRIMSGASGLPYSL